MFTVFRMRLRYVGWRCAFGLHKEWFTAANDAAWFTSVRRCANCGEAESKALLRRNRHERSLWTQVPKELAPDEQESWVLERL